MEEWLGVQHNIGCSVQGAGGRAKVHRRDPIFQYSIIPLFQYSMVSGVGSGARDS